MRRYAIGGCLWILLLMLSVFTARGVQAATLCVEPTGADGCYTTIQDGVDASSAGDTIEVRPGTYFENVVVPAGKDGLTITGATAGVCPFPYIWQCRDWQETAPADPDDVIVDAYNGCSNEEGFDIASDNVTISNLTVKLACNINNIYSTGDYTVIDNVHSIGAGWCGVYFDGAYPTITNSMVNGNLDCGIYSNGAYTTVTDNSIMNNGGYGIVVLPPASQSTIITGNTVYGAGYSCIYMYASDDSIITGNDIGVCAYNGIFTVDSRGINVSNNEIRSAVDSGITMANADGSVVDGNFMRSIDGFGILIDGDNITVSNNNVGGTIFLVGYFISCSSTCGTGTVTNNYAGYNTSGGGFFLFIDGWTIAGNTSEYNYTYGFLIVGDDNIVNNNIARYNGVLAAGFFVNGGGNTLTGNTAEYNNSAGFYINAPDGGTNTLSDNTATDNYLTGFLLDGGTGSGLTFSGNTADTNGEGIAMQMSDGSGTISLTDNTASANHSNYCSDYNANIDTFTGNLSDGSAIGTPLPGCEIN